MTPFAFDTLSASKRLREAGMEEGVAEAVVSIFQHAAMTPDVSHLATKEDLESLRLATKADFDALGVATKLDIRAEIMASEARVRETIRLQGWALMGGVGLMLAVFGGVAGFLA